MKPLKKTDIKERLFYSNWNLTVLIVSRMQSCDPGLKKSLVSEKEHYKKSHQIISIHKFMTIKNHINTIIWRFPEIGVPPNHLNFDGIFHEINQPAIFWGTPRASWKPPYHIREIHTDRQPPKTTAQIKTQGLHGEI